MNKRTGQPSLWGVLENINDNLKCKRLADVFRFVSFHPSETYGPHRHLRIEINYVKKGNCILHLDNESVTFRKGEIMIITSNINHQFEAGPEGTTLMQLEFLPEIFSHFSLDTETGTDDGSAPPTPVFLFAEENRLIKIVNNTQIIQTVQRIVNELESKNTYYQHLVVMYYAELLILIYRYMNEAYLPICTNEALKKPLPTSGSTTIRTSISARWQSIRVSASAISEVCSRSIWGFLHWTISTRYASTKPLSCYAIRI